MSKQETASDLAIKICERLGIRYHTGDGLSTVDSVPYDYESCHESSLWPFTFNNYSATIQIVPKLQKQKDVTPYDVMIAKDILLTTMHSSEEAISYQTNTSVPLIAA